MGYRGDDAARDRAAWGAQSPRQSSGEHAGYDGADYNSAGYDGADYNSTDYNSADYNSAGFNGGGYAGTSYGTYGQGDGYSQGDGYGSTSSYDSGSYSNTGGFSTGGHASNDYGAGGSYGTGSYSTGSYGTDSFGSGGYPSVTGHGSGAYPASDYGSGDHGGSSYGGDSYSEPSHGSGAYQSAPYDSSYDSYGSSSYGSSRASGGYPAIGSSSSASGGYPAISGGYPAIGHPSGGYPALGDVSYDDGNDWYGRSGPQPTGGFADTSAQLAVRDPARGYPPGAARPDDGLAHTGQQLRYDDSERVTYPGYDGVDDGYGKDNRGYDYDDYAGYEAAAGSQVDQRRTGQQEFETRLDQVAVDYDGMDAGTQGYDKTRRYGQALQGDDFDGGRYHDDYAGTGDDFLAGPGTGPRRALPGGRGVDERSPSGPISPAQNGSRQAGGGRKRRRTWLYATVALVLVALAAGGAYKFMLSGQDNAAKEANQPLPSSTASAATQQCATQLGQFCHIELRTDDPAPLTLSELYLTAFHSQADNQDFLLQTEKIDTNCANALFGTELISQVKTGQCNQVLRASYLSGDQTIMGTIGVVNLNTTNQAHYAGKIIGQSDFIQPLSTSKGLTAKLGKGVGVVQAHYKGHYLILTWAQFTNLKTPTTAQTQELENWENALMNGTANIYLSQRMVNGVTSATSPSGSPSASGHASSSASPSATH